MRENLIGQVFGRLTVIDRADGLVSESGYHTVMWKCKCDCGNIVNVRAKSLKQGVTKSCGCFRRDRMSNIASRHHGFGTRLYTIWNSMRQRCNNPKHHAYSNYGGRGITICKDWDDFDKFRKWAIGAGYDENAPRGQYTLDRVEVDRGYSPDNCRWVDMKTQSNNKRETIYLSYNGETLTLTEWADRVGLHYTTLWKRYKEGFDTSQILSTVR